MAVFPFTQPKQKTGLPKFYMVEGENQVFCGQYLDRPFSVAENRHGLRMPVFMGSEMRQKLHV